MCQACELARAAPATPSACAAQALFGDKLHNGNGTLTFLDYLKAVSVRVPRDPRLGRKGVGVPV